MGHIQDHCQERIINIAIFQYTMTEQVIGLMEMAGLDDIRVYGTLAIDRPYEPNDEAGSATPISNGETQTHSISPVGDEDWLTFTLSNESGVEIETTGNLNSDTRMWLYDSGLDEIEYDDDGGTLYFSFIDRVCGTDPLPAGTYYVKVDEYGDDSEISSYNVSLSITTCASSSTFPDVPTPGKEWMESWIEAFYDAGITSGCGYDGNGNLMYCPEREVTRAEMSVFVLRALNYPNLPYAPPMTSGTFSDVPVGGQGMDGILD